MELKQALAYCDELSAFARNIPGADPDGLRRVKVIVRAFVQDLQGSSYLVEKAGNVETNFDIGMSARKWQRYPQIQALCNNAVGKLRSICRQDFKGPDEA